MLASTPWSARLPERVRPYLVQQIEAKYCPKNRDVLQHCVDGDLAALQAALAACKGGSYGDTWAAIWGPRDKRGQNVMLVAAEKGHMHVLQWLFQTFAVDVTATDSEGRTAIMWPTQHGNLMLVKWLVQYGIDPSTATAKGYTPLLCAAHAGDVPLLAYLSGFQGLASTGPFGQTALHYAAINGRVQALQWLKTQPGVDVFARSTDNFTALDLAQRAGYIEAEEIIENWMQGDAASPHG